MRPLISILLATLLFSCSNGGSTSTDTAEMNDHPEATHAWPVVNDPLFQAFLDQFPKLDLPVTIKGCKTDPEGLAFFDEENPSPYVEAYSFAFGQIRANGDYISVITLSAADCLLPVLTTFKPTGEKIDSKTIAIGYCGEAPCFECEEFMTLREDYALYSADTIKTYQCDANYNPIQGTESIEVTYKEGKLTKTGQIELSAEQKKKLK